MLVRSQGMLFFCQHADNRNYRNESVFQLSVHPHHYIWYRGYSFCRRYDRQGMSWCIRETCNRIKVQLCLRGCSLLLLPDQSTSLATHYSSLRFPLFLSSQRYQVIPVAGRLEVSLNAPQNPFSRKIQVYVLMTTNIQPGLHLDNLMSVVVKRVGSGEAGRSGSPHRLQLGSKSSRCVPSKTKLVVMF